MDNQTINTIMQGVLIPLLPILTAYLIALLKKKTQEIEQIKSFAKYSKYIEIAENAVETAVTSVNQTIVDTAKKDGSWTSEKSAEAFETAKQKILSIIGDAVKQEIITVHGDLNSWLDSKIEACVNKSKTVSATAVSATVDTVVGQPTTA